MLALLLTILGASLVFASTVVSVPAPSPLPIGFERMTPLPFRAQVSRFKHRLAHLAQGRPKKPLASASGKPLTIAFYTSWTDESAPSLAHHIDQIDWVAPTLLQLDRSGGLAVTEDAPLRRVISGSIHRPLVVPVV